MPVPNGGTKPHSFAQLTPAERAILHALLRYHCMSIGQVTRLLYARSSGNWVQAKLRTLYDAGYLDRDRLPTRRADGPKPLYYVLTRKGQLALAAEGEAIPPRARPYRIHAWDLPHIAHLLAVNEVLIAATLLHDTQPAVEVSRWLHDLDLKARPTTITDAAGSRRLVVPDAFIDFLVRVGDGYRVPVCLELDRNTEKQRQFSQKIANLLRFAHGPYQEAFGRQSVTFCIVATKGPEHLGRLIAWTEAALVAQGAEEQGDFFQLATFPLDWDVPDDQRPTPAELFLAPRWSMPFVREAKPLFEDLA